MQPVAGEKRPSDFSSWLAYVEGFEAVHAMGLAIAEAPLPEEAARRPGSAAGGRVLVCAPHPDDEMLTGALALRLQREAGCGVTVLALTLGSDPGRKEERREELRAACRVAGFDWAVAKEPLGFELAGHPAPRPGQVDALCAHFQREQPLLVLVPHARDGHPTHRAAHQLVLQGLQRFTNENGGRVLLAETEYWQTMADPNLLLGVGKEDAALLLAALARHRGEVKRQPYHLWQLARQMDNVRRGAELLGGFGGQAAGFLFGELYRISRVEKGRHVPPGGRKHAAPPRRWLSLQLLEQFCAPAAQAGR